MFSKKIYFFKIKKLNDKKLIIIFIIFFYLLLKLNYYICDENENLEQILDDIDYVFKLYAEAPFVTIISNDPFNTKIFIEELYEELMDKYVSEGQIEVTYHKGYQDFYKYFLFPIPDNMDQIVWKHGYVVLTVNFDAKRDEDVFSEIDIIFDIKQGFFHIIETTIVHPGHLKKLEKMFLDKEHFATWNETHRNLYAYPILNMAELVLYKFILSETDCFEKSDQDFINKTYLKKYTDLTWWWEDY